MLPHIGRPVFGDDRNRDGTPLGPGGYGIYQVTVTNIPREQIWNWQKNVDAGRMILASKRTIANNWMNRQKDSSNANVIPLPNHTVGNVTFADGTSRTMVDAVTMKAYNGASRPDFSMPDNGGVAGFILDPHSSDHYCYWRNRVLKQTDPNSERLDDGTVEVADVPAWALSRLNSDGNNYVQRVCVEVE